MKERLEQLFLGRGSIDYLLRKLRGALKDNPIGDEKLIDIIRVNRSIDGKARYILIFKDINISIYTTLDNVIIESVPIDISDIDYNHPVAPKYYLEGELEEIQNSLLVLINKYGVSNDKDSLHNEIISFCNTFNIHGKFSIINGHSTAKYVLVLQMEGIRLYIPVIDTGISLEREIVVLKHNNEFTIKGKDLDPDSINRLKHLIVNNIKEHKIDWILKNKDDTTFESRWEVLERIFI